eukprot:scaffold89569_cov63-Phaeocystis_antarctica.AAC.2
MLRGGLRLRGQLRGRGSGLALRGSADGVVVVGVVLYKLLRPRLRDAQPRRRDDDSTGHVAEACDARLVRGLPRHDLGGQDAVGEQLDDWARHGPRVSPVDPTLRS